MLLKLGCVSQTSRQSLTATLQPYLKSRTHHIVKVPQTPDFQW